MLIQAADNEPGADITTAKVTMTAGRKRQIRTGRQKFGIKFTKAGSYTFTVTEQDSERRRRYKGRGPDLHLHRKGQP